MTQLQRISEYLQYASERLPRITPWEVYALFGTLFVLYVVPAVLAWSDMRRQRRLAQAAIPAPMHVEPPEFAGRAIGVPEFSAVETRSAGAPERELASGLDHPTAVEMNVEVEQPSSPITVSAPPVVEPGLQGIELRPLVGEAKHHFRLEDLHQVRLPDWPPSAVRTDAELHRSWMLAEQCAEQHRDAIRGASIASPYPARSTCLGAAEIDGATARLRYFLFPSAWPVSQNQAVAQAVFEIDEISGEKRGWVDALRSHELSDENRREIRESGGQA